MSVSCSRATCLDYRTRGQGRVSVVDTYDTMSVFRYILRGNILSAFKSQAHLIKQQTLWNFIGILFVIIVKKLLTCHFCVIAQSSLVLTKSVTVLDIRSSV